MPGIMTSLRTRSGMRSRIRASPSSPEAARCRSNSSDRRSFISLRTSGLSSMTTRL